MTFDVEAGGRAVRVTIETAAGGHLRATLVPLDESGADPQMIDLDVRQTAAGWSFVYLDDARTVEAAITPQPDGGRLVHLRDAVVPVTIDGHRARGAAGGRAAGAHRLAAPMPGRVLRVLVEPGQRVEARQALVVVEAMKMENELRASVAGQVVEIAVAPGDSVEAGRVLLIVEAV